ncbi:PepSY domain-containing protein [Lactobacillus sp.]|uniref:PepSY domain-containing protein n=1 Tax=Lactobacillus sp. TaxID=1591 RepID=UPI0019B8A3B0|nr:PepSY domain-containing protein [Lactobacillus sp.]MBD5429409.1 hypothetical protein [Lactobacillus sp.]MBD5430843.1 hypothetical protein [Lactobacillus sp.]
MSKNTKWVKLLSGVALGAALVMGTVACSSNNTNSTSSQSSTKSNSSKSSSESSSSSSSSSSSVNESTAKKESATIKVSQSEAVDMFNKKFADSKIKSIDLKLSGSAYVYSIDGFDSKKEHELTIDAVTGKEINSKSEALDSDEHNQKGLDLSKVISRSEAGKLAEKHVGSGSAIEWDLEMDENTGRPEWDITVESGIHRTEVKIDAINKKVLTSEHDN